MQSMHERAGINYLGQYRSGGRSKKLTDALHALSRAVEVPAYDYPLYKMVTDKLGYRLNVAEENRSVTSDEWVERAITGYGCPIHPTWDDYKSTGKSRGCTCHLRVGTGEAHNRRATTEAGKSRHSGTERQGSAVSSPSNADRGTTLPRVQGDVPDRGDRGSEPELAHRLAIRSVYSSAGNLEGRRKPLSLDEVVEHHIHRSSYAGLPLLASNGDVLDAGARLAHKVANGERGFDPYLFGRRVQPGPSGPKTRLVWMASLPTTIIGLAFSKPVQEALARNRPYIWGLQKHEEGAILSEMAGRFRYVYSVDWSQFDASISPSLINDMFRVVRSVLDLTDREDKLFWSYVNDFIHTRIVLPDGGVYQVHRGVPSGSAFTSLIDSMVNVYLMNYLWARLTGHTLSHNQLLVMGDDAVIASDEKVELADLSRIAQECGFKLNVQKSVIISTSEMGEGIHFIGHYWRHGRPRRPMREIITRMALPERHAKQDMSRSLTRMGGYALSSVDGLVILLSLFDQSDVVSALSDYLWELRASGGDDRLRAFDLPGDLRRRMLVEGMAPPALADGSGPFTLLFGTAF
jgi:hypothetical protein